MSILLIILGAMIGGFGARMFRDDQSQGGQSTGSGIVTLAIQLTGLGLIIWGVVRLFS